MGSDDCDGGLGRTILGNPHPRCADEKPAARVIVNPFWMQRNEMTSESLVVWAGRAGVEILKGMLHEKSSDARLPAHFLDFDEARAVCQVMGGDLPTEAQWEFAAHRGDPERVYPWGREPPTCDRAVTGDHNCSHGQSSPVCSRPTGNTPEGLCDLSGNVWEWVRWSFAGVEVDGMLPYPVQPKYGDDPQWRPPESPSAEPSFASQPIRGGGHWQTDLFFNRARARYAMPRSTREGNIGFRVSGTLGSSPSPPRSEPFAPLTDPLHWQTNGAPSGLVFAL